MPPRQEPPIAEARERRQFAAAPAVDRRRAGRRRRPRTVWFLNAAFDDVTPEQAFARLASSWTGRPFSYVVTPNVDHIVRLEDGDGALRALYARAGLVICDSRVLEAMARLSGLTLHATPGSDLVARLFNETIAPDDPIAVIGGSKAVVDALRDRYGLTALSWHEPPRGLASNPAAIRSCAAFAASRPFRYVLFAVGSPQQEMVAAATLARGDATGLGLCVGAALDFLSGVTPRAPRWMRALRLEWLHRIATEPKRLWRRYLVDGRRVFAIWRAWERQNAAIAQLAGAARTRSRLRRVTGGGRRPVSAPPETH